MPSRGLTEEQIGRTLKCIGLPAVRYPVRSGGEESELLLPEAEVSALVRRYLNSRIPLVLATPGHLTAIIGATEKDGVLEVIRCDDEQGAYCPQAIDMDPESKERWLFLFVPLPGRIYLVGEEILAPGRNTLAALTQRAEFQEHSLRERKLRYREYVIDSRIYKTALQTRGLPQRTVQGHCKSLVRAGSGLSRCRMRSWLRRERHARSERLRSTPPVPKAIPSSCSPMCRVCAPRGVPNSSGRT